MSNTPAFIVHGALIDDDRVPPDEAAIVASVVTRLAKHGSQEVADALSSGTFVATIEFIRAGFTMTMASKTFAEALPVSPLDLQVTVEADWLRAPGTHYTNAGTEKCPVCGAHCQTQVRPDGCVMCEDDDDEHPYHECDCEASCGPSEPEKCPLHHRELPHYLQRDGMPKPCSWQVIYEEEEWEDGRMANQGTA